MRTYSYISAVALAAALITTPQAANAQSLGVDLGGAEVSVGVGGDGGLGVDASVNAGGDSGIDVDADVGVGGGDSGSNLVDANVEIGSRPSGSSQDSLVDVDLGVGSSPSAQGGTGPNGGRLIDLNARVLDRTVVDGKVDVLGVGPTPATSAPGGNNLLTGTIRIGAIAGQDARVSALLALVNKPGLADIDLDAAIDDRRVSIIAAADLLDADALADLELAIGGGGDGRAQLLGALTGSKELSSILGSRGIDLEDVVAVQIAENGATEVIVLADTLRIALGGEDGNIAELGLADVAELDVDLLSDEELAKVDLDLLPENQRAQVQLRLLSGGGDLADIGVEQLAKIDLDLLSDEQLASLDLDAVPETLRAPIQLRLLDEDGELANLSVRELAQLDVGLQSAAAEPDDGNTGTDDGTGGKGGTKGNGRGGNDTGVGGGGSGDDVPGGGAGGNGNNDGGTAAEAQGRNGSTAAGNGQAVIPGSTANPANSLVASLDCEIGVLALAKGMSATAETIASAQSLELVRIEGCERSLVDADIGAIHQAVEVNPAIAAALEEAEIASDQIVGATIQAGVLTLFIDPVTS